MTEFSNAWAQHQADSKPIEVDLGRVFVGAFGKKLRKVGVVVAPVLEELEQQSSARKQAEQWATAGNHDLAALDSDNRNPVHIFENAERIYHAFRAPDEDGEYTEHAFESPDWIAAQFDATEQAQLLNIYDLAVLEKHRHTFGVGATEIRDLRDQLCATADDDVAELTLARFDFNQLASIMVVMAQMWQSDVAEMAALMLPLEERQPDDAEADG